MELEPIGRIENLEDENFEPIVMPIVGYDEDGDEVVVKIRFRPWVPTKKSLDMRGATIKGVTPTNIVLDYLEKCVLKEDRQAWNDLLDSDDVFIKIETFGEIARTLGSIYDGKHPTKQRSDLPGGGQATEPTTRAAATSKDSTSKKLRSVSA
jgi:hypothetical protein